MARIIVSYYKVQETDLEKRLCFWDGFVQDLRNEGNDVLVVNTAYFNSYKSNVVKNPRINEYLLEGAKSFNPDLMIAFNHRIPQCYLDSFDVPIIIWDGDAPEFLCDLEGILDSKDRYTIFTISEEWQRDYLDYGFDQKNIYYVPPATSIRSKPCDQMMNISFLGSRVYQSKWVEERIKTHKYSHRFYDVVKGFFDEPRYDYSDQFKLAFSDYPELQPTDRDLWPLFDIRWLVLANMLDLGLTISDHNRRWEAAADYMPQIAAALNPETIWTLEDNERFYNSSIISLCPLHPQAEGSAFSWRVFDIMASNACLLMSHSSSLKKLTEGYVDIPMFDTPWEARELAIKLLEDDDYRKSIVTASQRYVEENARWRHRFLIIEEAVSLPIIGADSEKCVVSDAVFDNPLITEYIEQYGKKALSESNVREKSTQKRTGKDVLVAQFFNRLKKLKTTWLKVSSVFSVVKVGLIELLAGLVLTSELFSSQPVVVLLGKVITALGCAALALSLLLAIAIIVNRQQRKK